MVDSVVKEVAGSGLDIPKATCVCDLEGDSRSRCLKRVRARTLSKGINGAKWFKLKTVDK